MRGGQKALLCAALAVAAVLFVASTGDSGVAHGSGSGGSAGGTFDAVTQPPPATATLPDELAALTGVPPILLDPNDVGGAAGSGGFATAAETYAYFSNILVIMMLSPSRYHLARHVRDHYAPFFKHMFFCGPKKTEQTFMAIDGIPVSLYDIVYGNEQYRAVAAIIREVAANYSGSSGGVPFEGVLYIGDDVLLQPWSLAGRRLDRNSTWATQMGIANVKSARDVSAVPGMSVQGKFRAQWPYWRKNRPKLLGVHAEGGDDFQRAMLEAAQATHPLIYKWSKYSRRLLDDDAKRWSIFYTIVDTYYVPWRLALRYAERCDLMAKHWVFGECAIATALRSLQPTYETMAVQFYWSTLSAADCHRYRWSVGLDGFHRCRHDHRFSHLMYSGGDDVRRRLRDDKQFTAKALALNGLDESGAVPKIE